MAEIGSDEEKRRLRLAAEAEAATTDETPEYRDMLSRLSIDGVADFCEAKSRVLKFLWLAVLIVACVVSLVEIRRTILNYKNSPVSTAYSVLPLGDRPFPQLYLCPFNAVDKRKVAGFDQLKKLQNFAGLGASIVRNRSKILSMINTNYDVLHYTSTRARILAKDLDTVDLFKYASMDISDFVKECSFQRQYMNCSEITRKVFDGNFGQCYIINVGRPQKVSGYGLNVALDVRRDLYHERLMPAFDGIRFGLFDEYGPALSAGQPTPPGGWAKVDLHSRSYKLLNVDSNILRQPCYSSGDKPGSILNRSKTLVHYDGCDLFGIIKTHIYAQKTCNMDCAQILAMEHCECLLPIDKTFIPDQLKERICNVYTLSRCFYGEVLENYRNELAECNGRCLPLCDYWDHVKAVSWIGFSSANAVGQEAKMAENDQLNASRCNTRHFDDDRSCRDTIILDIGYSDLLYTEIQQSESMTVDTFISNIGGQVGLWMGVSIISVFQLFTVFVTFCLGKCRRKS